MPHSDADIIQECLQGEERAYGFLVDKYKGAVHALAHKKLSDYHEAEDVAQEVFLRAYRNLHSLRQPECLAGWLYVITANECRRRIRRRMRQARLIQSAQEEDHSRSETAEGIHTEHQLVHGVLADLRESEQTVIYLHYFGGLTCEEMSRFLGMSRNAVRMRLSRARGQMRREITQMLERHAALAQLPMQFTLRIMEHVTRMPIISPKPIWLPFAKLAPVAVLLLVTVLLGLGRYSQPQVVPPMSWDGTQETYLSAELLEWPIHGHDWIDGNTSLTASTRPPQFTSGVAVGGESGDGEPGHGLADMPDDNTPHVSGVIVSKRTGQPISGATVTLLYRGAPPVQVKADDSGYFLLGADASGKNLWIQAEGYGIRFVQFPKAQEIVTGMRIALDQAASIRGKVVDEERQPIANARITVHTGNGYMRGSPLQTQTDSQGRYALSGLSPGMAYGLSADLPGYRCRTPVAVIPALHGKQAQEIIMERWQYPEVAIAPSEEVTPRAGVRVYGTVSTADATPIEGATLLIGIRDDRVGLHPERVEAHTDAEGQYAAENLWAGPLRVVVRAAGFSPQYTSIDAEPHTSAECNMTLETSPLLKGQVVNDVTGEPIPNTTVSMSSWQDDTHRHGDNILFELHVFSQTDRDGKFILNEIPQIGLFSVGLIGVDHSHDAMGHYRYDREHERFTDVWEEVLDGPVIYKVRPPAWVRVRVVDDITGEPIPQFWVDGHITPIGAEMSRTTEQDGVFIFAPDGVFSHPLPKGRKTTLSFLADGYAPGLVEKAVAQVEPEAIILRLKRERVLHGRIVNDTTGQPVLDAWVKVFSEYLPLRLHGNSTACMSGHSAQSDAEGKFVLRQLGETVSFCVLHPSFAPVFFFDHAVLESADAPMTIRLDQGAQLEGTAPPNLPIALSYAETTLGQQGDFGNLPFFQFTQQTRIDSQGRFLFEKLPAGRYYLQLNRQMDHPRLELDYQHGQAGYPEQPVQLVEVKAGMSNRLHLGWVRKE